jgi:uncharacterized membrane protein YjgN (DUF898 family)
MDLHRGVSLVAAAPVLPVDLGHPDEPGGTPQPVETALVFTGRGDEYFRIWIVNSLLTLLTLGIYSAWAKVRRTRYLWQNTRLDGFAFDYHARPVAILRGRLLAFALFGAYSVAFDFSRNAGLMMIGVLCAVGPWLFMRAQQFKLANSSWRGLRFGFDARSAEAYRVVLPTLLIWFSGTLAAVVFSDDLQVLLWSQLPALLLLPWMHHRLKAYQHRRAYYGDRAFAFQPARLRFYAVYVKGVLVGTLGSIVAGGLFVGAIALTAYFAREVIADEMRGDPERSPFVLFFTVVSLLIVFVFAWPYLAARLQQVVWSATRLDGVRFHTRIAAWRLFRLTLANVLLTLLTLGLYWPFAAMRFAKYRIECMHVVADEPFASIAAGTHSRSVGAGGDSAADAFGLDLGL